MTLAGERTSASVYSAVVPRQPWGRIDCAWCTSAPPSRRCVAQSWLREWDEIRPGMRAASSLERRPSRGDLAEQATEGPRRGRSGDGQVHPPPRGRVQRVPRFKRHPTDAERRLPYSCASQQSSRTPDT
jgi:hypothetical protein